MIIRETPPPLLRKTSLSVLVLATLVFAIQAATDPEVQLRQAAQSLTGEHKETAKAEKLLRQIIATDPRTTKVDTRAWAFLYLGYIHDRAGERPDALASYHMALALEGISDATRRVAETGLAQPVTWLRHLDAGPSNASPRTAEISDKPPESRPLVIGLTPGQRRENFESLATFLDRNYAHFILKSIDWNQVVKRYRTRLDSLASDTDFYNLLYQLVNELKDTHSWLQNYRPPQLAGVDDLPVDVFQGTPYIIAGPKAGWQVVAVDSLSAKEKIDFLRPLLHTFSSERAWQREAGRLVLAGSPGTTASVQLRAPDGRIETVSAPRDRLNRPPDAFIPIPGLTVQRYVHFGRHPSGIGYIRIASFGGREEISLDFDRALDELRDAPALILDIRDNLGGYGHPEIVGRFLDKPVLGGISYQRNGPRHGDLQRKVIILNPSGKWHYNAPIALLVNDLTGSASDLFACELRSARRVITIGTTTHGNLSGSSTYITLPCGLVVRTSNGYITDADERPIEINGNVPDVVVEPHIEDHLNHRDPVLEKAIEKLRPATVKLR
jgi:carboxyl-terminal processing protease